MGDAKPYMDKIYEKLGCLLLAASKRHGVEANGE
ncbi:unnamed protein product [Rhodiola kirilowii]